MMKKTITVILMVCFVVALSGCGGEVKENNITPPADTFSPNETPVIQKSSSTPTIETVETPEPKPTHEPFTIPEEDGTEVNLIFNGHEMPFRSRKPVVKDGEVFFPISSAKDEVEKALDIYNRARGGSSFTSVRHGVESVTAQVSLWQATVVLPIQIIDDANMVSLMALLEAASPIYEWDRETKTLSVVDDAAIISIIAEDYTEVTVIMNQNQYAVELTFSGQQPIVMDNEVLVPILGVFEYLEGANGAKSMSYKVTWDAVTFTANIGNNFDNVTIKAGEEAFTLNGSYFGRQTVSAPVPLQKIGGQYMMPLIAIAKSMGKTVIWNEESRTIQIYQISLTSSTN